MQPIERVVARYSNGKFYFGSIPLPPPSFVSPTLVVPRINWEDGTFSENVALDRVEPDVPLSVSMLRDVVRISRLHELRSVPCIVTALPNRRSKCRIGNIPIVDCSARLDDAGSQFAVPVVYVDLPEDDSLEVMDVKSPRLIELSKIRIRVREFVRCIAFENSASSGTLGLLEGIFGEKWVGGHDICDVPGTWWCGDLESLIGHFENMRSGDDVIAFWPGNSKFYPGKVVIGEEEEGEVEEEKCKFMKKVMKKRTVKYNDGDTKDIRREQIVPDVMLSLRGWREAAKRLVNEEEPDLERALVPGIALWQDHFYRGGLRVSTPTKFVFAGRIGGRENAQEEGVQVPLCHVRLHVGEWMRRVKQKESERPCDEMKRRQALFSDFTLGEPGFGYWPPNRCFYSGHIARISENKTVRVDFTDGESRICTTGEAYRHCSEDVEVKIGDSVLARWTATQWWEGIVDMIEVSASGERTYHVLYADGDESYYPRSRVVPVGPNPLWQESPIPPTLGRELLGDNVLYPLRCKLYAEDPFPEILKVCERSRRRFVDPTFSPNDKFSVCSRYDHSTFPSNSCCARPRFVEWKSLDENIPFLPPDDGMCDVRQGKVGNCWLICMLPHLSQDRIREMFNPPELSRWGVYTVKLRVENRDVWVVVDDLVPMLRPSKGETQPVFARSQKGLAYVLLEKVFAKLFGGYHNLCGGKKGLGLPNRSCFVAHALFGCRGSKPISWDLKNPPAGLFQRLVELKSRGAILNVFKALAKEGLTSGHAYSISGLHEIPGPSPRQFIVIRNPQGDSSKIWTGDWSQESGLWNLPENATIRERLYGIVGQNGSFVMDFDQFVRHFKEVDAYLLESTWDD